MTASKIARSSVSPRRRTWASGAQGRAVLRSTSTAIGRPPPENIVNACVPNNDTVPSLASERDRTLTEGERQRMSVTESVRSRPPGAARRGFHPALTLTFGGLLLLGGRAGDILGRRRVFITGILVFTLASLLGGLATSSAWLLAARAL